jgi:hypothetical protein
MRLNRGKPFIVQSLVSRIVGLASRLIPRAARADWEREWRAELWYLWRELEMRDARPAVRWAAFLRRSLGAPADALQMRLGDAQFWRDSASAVANQWGQRPGSVVLALFLLSVGIAGGALLVAFGAVMIEAPHSVWGTLGTEIRLLILGVAAGCGVFLIATGGAAAARLLGPWSPAPERDGAWIVETLLVAGVTAWLARWFAEFYARTAIPPYPGEWLASVDLGAAVTSACALSWFCGLTALTGLRLRHRRTTAVVTG